MASERPSHIRLLTPLAEYLEEPAHMLDVVDALTQKGPFTVYSTHFREEPIFMPRVALCYRPHPPESKTFPWLGNNVPSDEWRFHESKINGLFRVDSSNQRLLFSPYVYMSNYDSYRGLNENGQLTFAGTLLDIIAAFQSRDFPIVQITTLRQLETEHMQSTAFQPAEIVALCSSGQKEFGHKTGYPSYEAYQVEGYLSVEDILQEQFLPIRPLVDKTEALNRWRQDWRVVS